MSITAANKVSGKMGLFCSLSVNDKLLVKLIMSWFLFVCITHNRRHNKSQFWKGRSASISVKKKKKINWRSLSGFWDELSSIMIPCHEHSCLAFLRKEHPEILFYLTSALLSWHRAPAPKKTVSNQLWNVMWSCSYTVCDPKCKLHRVALVWFTWIFEVQGLKTSWCSCSLNMGGKNPYNC